MKNKIQLLALFSVLLTSCNLDLAPENVMVDQNVYCSAKTAKAALMGAYVRMNIFLGGAPEDQNNYSYMSLCWLAGDMGTDNMKSRGASSDCEALETGEYSSSVRDGSILTSWQKGYNAIDYANNIIDGIGRFGEFDETLEKQYVAEARFLRAFVYFNLLKMFGDGALTGNEEGLGLIIRDKPYDGYNPDQVVTRSTVRETWDFIISDLEAAVEDLPSETGAAADRYLATRPVAWALLSRVYLYRGSYKSDKACMAKAVEYAEKVLGTADYVFSKEANDHKANLFPANEYSSTSSVSYPDPVARSKELIFYQPSRISTDIYPNGIGSTYYQKRTVGVETSWVQSTYSDGDYRGYVEGSSYSMIGTGGSSYYPTEFTTLKYTNSAGYDDVVFIRLSEVKLNLAEALARRDGGVSQAALDQLNEIRCKPFVSGKTPAKFSLSDFSDSQKFLVEILAERNRELAFESHRRWDLVRTGGKLRNEALSDAQKILPIPDYEVRISKGKIKQNSAFE